MISIPNYIFLILLIIFFVKLMKRSNHKKYIISKISEISGFANRVFGLTSSYVFSIIAYRKFIGITFVY